MTQLTDLIADEGPLGLVLVAEFEAGYTDVEYKWSIGHVWACQRCGGQIASLDRPLHLEWHRNTSFRIFLLQAYVRDHTATHLKVSQQLLQVHEDLMALVEKL